MVHNGITQGGTLGKAKQKIVVLYFYNVQFKAERCFPFRDSHGEKGMSLIFNKVIPIL